MKIRKLFKKAAALALAAVTALSVMPATTAFAAGDIGTISFTHTYDSNGNAMRSILVRINMRSQPLRATMFICKMHSSLFWDSITAEPILKKSSVKILPTTI